ncbi:Protein kinase superfamily protein [Striga hermonthica]|uniref:Protein kinase superfamily protein n=1 Tax=Striga hermonthica TaxID=68872 RepID=A0A9N7RSF6_STRHE|nr:Protein kinase superfamily protein [Striga hermonthica]
MWTRRRWIAIGVGKRVLGRLGIDKVSSRTTSHGCWRRVSQCRRDAAGYRRAALGSRCTRIISRQRWAADGHLYVKSDVYGFGVVLLEIITGLRVLDLSRPSGQTNLVDWAKPFLPNKKKLRKLMDPRLQGQYPSKAAFGIAELILKCLEPDQKLWPDMEEILCELEKMNEIHMKPKEVRAQGKRHQQNGDLYPRYHGRAHHTYEGRSGGQAHGAGPRDHNNAKVVRTY